MDGFERALELLPGRLRQKAERFRGTGVEELRLRTGRPPTALVDGRERELDSELVTRQELLLLLEKATGASLHTAAPALAEGFLSYRGLRLGLCGEALIREGELAGFRDFRSAAIRIPRECRGICDGVMDSLYGGGYENTLVISRPGGGKTTALRELIRKLSDRGLRVAVVDERNELLAADGTGEGFDLGAHTDVLTGAPKARGALWLLRGMNPQLLAMDEITRREDLEAAAQAAGCGAWLLASAHAADADELKRRPLYRELLELGLFQRLLVISGTGSARRYRAERLAG